MPLTNSNYGRAAFRCAIVALALSSLAARATAHNSPASPQDVVTYHVGNFRTGWYSSETQLTVANVTPSTFGLLQVVALDGRVDAQPLYVYGQAIDGQGVHNVLYLATETNSVYAMDADNGVTLWHKKFGLPVTDAFKSSDPNVYPVMGILGTPVIDEAAGLMYFVADNSGVPTDNFRLHAIYLSNGNDAMAPATIHLSETLADGTQWVFNPRYQLQRSALLESNGAIYVAFGSNGDFNPDQSRGMIVAFDAATLTPLNGQISNKLVETSHPFYLSSIWQSGYGVAADSNGDIFFSTGNSDPRTPSYSPSFNRPDSMVRLSSDLLTLKDSFTPYNYFQLDEWDMDVGSGGMLLLPDQPGPMPHLAVAGGKDGREFLLNRDNLGGFNQNGPDNVVQSVSMGACWCGPAYYVGADSAAHILTGGGHGVTSWSLQTSPSVQLIQESSTGSSPVRGLPDNGGTMPVVSSNGTTAGTGIVWFVQRPALSSDQNPGTPLTLWAFSATNLGSALFSATAGTWTHASNSNANVVPVVANGKVYVASNMQLRIFGLTGDRGSKKVTIPTSLEPSAPDIITCPYGISALNAIVAKDTAHDFFGTVCEANGSVMRLALRSGRAITIDVSHAFDQQRQVLLTPGRFLHVTFTVDKAGVAHAQRILPLRGLSTQTPADR